MTSVANKLATLTILLALVGCRSPVPRDHTSLVLDPGEDPGQPPKRLSMVWHHHSTGDNLLRGGLLAALQANNIAFHDINYEEAVVDGYVIGDHTESQDFPKNFNTPKHLAKIKGWELTGQKKQHDIIMFKSCFPSSNIENAAMLEAYKGYYNSLLPTFEDNPEILFIAMSTPPLVKYKTTPDNASWARAWSIWVTTEYATDLPNVQVFDLFGATAILEGKPDQNTLAPQFAEAATDSHPTAEAARAVTRMFIPWLNRAVRKAGLVK